MSTHRGTSNSNTRGSSYDRRRLRAAVVKKFGSQSGKTVRCFWCKHRMRTRTLRHPNGSYELDRWPLCGHDGGRYNIENVVPACTQCNKTRCSALCRVGAVQKKFVWIRKVAA